MFVRSRNLYRSLLAALLVSLMVCLAAFPERYLPACSFGLKLWATAVLPSLLPFFFLTTLLTSTGGVGSLSRVLSPATRLLYREDGISGYVQLMSFISGYPVGAKIIADLSERGVITPREATGISTFTSTSGPLFIVGSVSIAMFGSKTLGAIMLSVHLLSSVICGICFRGFGTKRRLGESENHSGANNALYDAIYGSVISVLIVGGFIAVFYVLSQILIDFKVLLIIEKPLELVFGSSAEGFAVGLIECTSGCKLLSEIRTPLSAALASALVSFGGISVICQSAIYLSRAGASIKIFILSKILQMVISGLLTFAVVSFVPVWG